MDAGRGGGEAIDFPRPANISVISFKRTKKQSGIDGIHVAFKIIRAASMDDGRATRDF